jgi:hypothetical protein
MSVEESVAPKKDKRSKTHHGEPRKPEMVLDIIEGRDKRKETWEALGDKYDMTRAGARHLYHKWYDWFQKMTG